MEILKGEKFVDAIMGNKPEIVENSEDGSDELKVSDEELNKLITEAIKRG